MKKKDKKYLYPAAIILVLVLLVIGAKKLTGNAVVIEDQFSGAISKHWTHMPLTYTLKSCENMSLIEKAMNTIKNSTNRVIDFKEIASNPDIEISCSSLENCYNKKTERRWFWIITTEATCSHETGTAKIEKIKGNKILKAKIDLVYTGKEENCAETIIHEILHVFGYNHIQDNSSIMNPVKDEKCNEKIDSEIIDDLMKNYRL